MECGESRAQRPQQTLYFFPLPRGQRSLRPVSAYFLLWRIVAVGDIASPSRGLAAQDRPSRHGLLSTHLRDVLNPALHPLSLLVLAVTFGVSLPVYALDFTRRFEISGLLAGAYQCQQTNAVNGPNDACRGAVVLQPEMSYEPTTADQFFVKLGFAIGNGLSNVSPFELSPWAADLEADVKNINGSGRSYLLETWYGRTFALGQDNQVQLIGGIIDPSAHLNLNAYANDEFTQFSNAAFVNARNLYMPAYDWGGVIVWQVGNLTLSGAGMLVNQNEDGNDYNWAASEVAYRLDTRLGDAHYRPLYSTTSQNFPSATDTGQEPLTGLFLSFDQALGEDLGAFLRASWDLTDAAGTYRSGYEGGFDFNGAVWGREGATQVRADCDRGWRRRHGCGLRLAAR